jgi:hypothetical protein
MFDLNFSLSQQKDAVKVPEGNSSPLGIIPFSCNSLLNPANENEKVSDVAYRLFQPSELRSHLGKCLTENYKDWQLDKVAHSICNAVNEIIHPENTVKVVKKKSEDLKNKGFYWCIFDNENRNVSILIRQQQIGKKTNKTVFKAPCLSFDLLPRNHVRGSSTRSFVVLKQTDGKKIRRILTGRSIQKEIIQSVTGGNFAQLPQFLSKPTENLLEMYMEWYNADLKRAMLEEKVPLDIQESQSVPIDMGDAVDVLIDVVRSTGLMHEKGYVHGDPTPSNILIKLNAEGKVEGFLSDFDLASKVGFYGGTNTNSQESGQYFFWDLVDNIGRFVWPGDDFSDAFCERVLWSRRYAA